MWNIARLRHCFEKEAVFYTQHAKIEMECEEFGEVTDAEIGEAIATGQVIREYPEDKPYPSLLVLGYTRSGRPLHIVCACDTDAEKAIVVTVYQPDPTRWLEDRTRRRP